MKEKKKAKNMKKGNEEYILLPRAGSNDLHCMCV